MYGFGLLKKLIMKPSRKGVIGENKLQRSIDSLDFWGYDGYCLRNTYVPKANGTTAEIDLLYITRKGIFVIESKNYVGYIFGNEHWKMWTSTVYAGKNWMGLKKVNKNKFYNPIWQNKSHISALKNFCGNVQVFSIIAFGNNCEIINVNWDSPNTWVCYYSDLKRIIKGIWTSSPDIYDEAMVNRMYSSLISLDKSRETKARHINQIYHHPANGKCPKCGGNLVMRQAKKGIYAGSSFYGCSNYPRCKYIENINSQ